MPSDAALPSSPPPRADRGWLRSQGLGLLCGQATVLLLAVGSFQLASLPEGSTAGGMTDDLRVFFREPSWGFAWFYLLLPVLGLLALNTLLCTWQNVVARWRAGVRSAAAYGPAVVHVGFLLAMGAHAVQGLLAVDPPPVLLGSDWAPLDGGGEARVVSVAMDRHPDGSPKEIRAEVERRDSPTGPVRRETVGINRPLSSGLGARLHLVADFGSRLDTARLADPATGREVTLRVGAPPGPGGLELLGLERSGGGYASRPVAVVRAAGAPRPLLLPWGEAVTLPDGSALRLAGVDRSPWLLLRPRRSPGSPWAFASALVTLAGCAMMGRRWL